MNEKYNLIAFLAGLITLVLIIALGVTAVAFKLRNPEAYELFAAAITGLIMVLAQLIRGRKDE